LDKEQKAIERIKQASELSLFHYQKPLVCCYSGGKDSDVLLELFKRSGIYYEVHNSHTTVESPETVYHIRKKFKELENQGIKVTVEMPKYQGENITMWSLIPKKTIPPTRIMRYCCQILKETGCKNRFIATGVRWDESNRRKKRAEFETITKNKKDKTVVSDEIMMMNDNDEKRKLIEHCQLKSKSVVNPIIDWTHTDIWGYIRGNNISYNPMYDNGYSRVGCIGCPMAGKSRFKEFADYPTYKRAYIRAFDKMLNVRKFKGNQQIWVNGESVMNWWLEIDKLDGQIEISDYI